MFFEALNLSTYTANIIWKRDNQNFIDNKYSRAHTWIFDGGCEIPASPSPHIVPPPYSVEENVDPEEAYVASLSSCHMLFFLSIAAKKKLLVDSYDDNAEGVLEENSEGQLAMTRIILDPKIIYSGKQPSEEEIQKMHHLAHQQCFLANSVKTVITVKGMN
jgi:organic hydroperoxide reductase OsmC/OhrA